MVNTHSHATRQHPERLDVMLCAALPVERMSQYRYHAEKNASMVAWLDETEKMNRAQVLGRQLIRMLGSAVATCSYLGRPTWLAGWRLAHL